MNAAAANALYEAERNGVRQLRRGFKDSSGAKCASQILMDAELLDTNGVRRTSCPMCDARDVAIGCGCDLCVIIHLNDDHGLTFSEIARKLGPDSA